MHADLKRIEEHKREACWNSVDQWRILQETIAWIDAQQQVPRNSRRGCLERQSRLISLIDVSLIDVSLIDAGPNSQFPRVSREI